MDSNEHGLQNIFYNYSGSTHEINERTFQKLYQEAHVMDSDLEKEDLIAIFKKVKPQGAMKIGYEEFKESVKLAAAKKKIPQLIFESILSKSHGPKARGTTPEKIRFHDDKTTFTGVHTKGGPTNVDKGHTIIGDLSDLANRKEADVRGVVKHD